MTLASPAGEGAQNILAGHFRESCEPVCSSLFVCWLLTTVLAASLNPSSRSQPPSTGQAGNQQAGQGQQGAAGSTGKGAAALQRSYMFSCFLVLRGHVFVDLAACRTACQNTCDSHSFYMTACTAANRLRRRARLRQTGLPRRLSGQPRKQPGLQRLRRRHDSRQRKMQR